MAGRGVGWACHVRGEVVVDMGGVFWLCTILVLRTQACLNANSKLQFDSAHDDRRSE